MTEHMWTCCGEEVFDTPGIIKHLTEVHGLPAPHRTERTTVMCLDGPGWFANTYEHKIGGLVLHQTVKGPKG